jgi:hypothetical protein
MTIAAPPRPPANPVFGSALDMRRSRIRTYARAMREHGDVGAPGRRAARSAVQPLLRVPSRRRQGPCWPARATTASTSSEAWPNSPRTGRTGPTGVTPQDTPVTTQPPPAPTCTTLKPGTDIAADLSPLPVSRYAKTAASCRHGCVHSVHSGCAGVLDRQRSPQAGRTSRAAISSRHWSAPVPRVGLPNLSPARPEPAGGGARSAVAMSETSGTSDGRRAIVDAHVHLFDHAARR